MPDADDDLMPTTWCEVAFVAAAGASTGALMVAAWVMGG